jgi:aryl-alcohol dehydrogenase-like predicted oxidoreductase
MKRRTSWSIATLARLGVKVSPLCLGTMNFGWEGLGTPEEDAFRIMDRALEPRLNFSTPTAR